MNDYLRLGQKIVQSLDSYSQGIGGFVCDGLFDFVKQQIASSTEPFSRYISI